MNNKFKRVLSSLLAFVMLLSCVTVMNVSSVWAAGVDVTGTVDPSLGDVGNLVYLINRTTGDIVPETGAALDSNMNFTIADVPAAEYYAVVNSTKFTENRNVLIAKWYVVDSLLPPVKIEPGTPSNRWDFTNKYYFTDKVYTDSQTGGNLNLHGLIIEGGQFKPVSRKTYGDVQVNTGTKIFVPIVNKFDNVVANPKSTGYKNYSYETDPVTKNDQLYKQITNGDEQSFILSIEVLKAEMIEVSGTVADADTKGVKKLTFTDKLTGVSETVDVTNNAYTVELAAEREYKVKTDNEAVATVPELCNTTTDAKQTKDFTLDDTKYVTISGKVTNELNYDTIKFIDHLYFKNASGDIREAKLYDDCKYEVRVVANETYTCYAETNHKLYPENVDMFTSNRVKVGETDITDEEVYFEAEFTNFVYKDTIFVKKAASTSFDSNTYSSINTALKAVKAMSDRGDKRVQIVLNDTDSNVYEEAVIVDTPNVTLVGSGKTVTSHYGFGYVYYGLDSKGYYSEALFRDKFEKNAPKSNWGATLTLRAPGFISYGVKSET